MALKTDFAVSDNYNYLEGLGNYHQSEAFPGANSHVNNSPQKPPYGLKTERISGTSFTAPREQNLQTWMYRATPSLFHSEYVPYDDAHTPNPPTFLSPNSYMWPTFPTESGVDWVSSQKLLARNGDPAGKEGLAIWTFSITNAMRDNTAFSSIDGDCLIIPQSGGLDIQTEFGKLLVRQNEICVIPRGIRYRVALPNGPAHGFICELFQSHFQLPGLGIVGSTGLANQRDFQIPVAFFDGQLREDVAVANDTEWTLISRQAARLWTCTQDHTPFDVAAWHGTNYPFKYDLAKFCVLGNVLFDEHDPCLYTVLTAPAHREPGNAVVDFAIIPPRWMASEDTLWLPYYHRNTMNEFYAPIVNNQDGDYPFNQDRGKGFKPFGAGLNGGMVVHGATAEDLEKASTSDTSTPAKVMMDGITIFLLETEKPLYISDWAAEMAQQNFKAKEARPKSDSRL
ncbi:homogentisate 1,2-dioxygenase [Cyphellophora europaea CBS 101466]|uniref:homogentisate 1,2-dioxygenase n=1 Tax=Cyphellophora europaea (strain CBS 101466) TaxID=1220924 RepID=W2S5V5_CYPE1|nr:homogentisate 1,2-dioxygenase [Cyphellophora europaea CBS 101466]ETN44096.1 homogentisate 1,2-dioxygenase [Cyphellophora europaea CBS 101466]